MNAVLVKIDRIIFSRKLLDMWLGLRIETFFGFGLVMVLGQLFGLELRIALWIGLVTWLVGGAFLIFGLEFERNHSVLNIETKPLNPLSWKKGLESLKTETSRLVTLACSKESLEIYQTIRSDLEKDANEQRSIGNLSEETIQKTLKYKLRKTRIEILLDEVSRKFGVHLIKIIFKNIF